MKKFLVALLFLVSTAIAGNVGYYTEQTVTPTGVTVVRVANALDVTLACYIQDNFNYTTFYVYPRSYSMWYPVYSQYIWNCHY